MTISGPSFHRDYVVDELTAQRASTFAAATVIAALGPEDWQVSQDVAEACHHLLTDRFADGGAIGHRVDITVGLHSDTVGVELADDQGWSSSARVRPRRPFHCRRA